MPIFGSTPTTTANVPNDLSQSRNDVLGLMRSLLGMPAGNQPGAPSSGPGGAVGGSQNWFGQGNTATPQTLGTGPTPGGMNAGAVNFGGLPGGQGGLLPNSGFQPQTGGQGPMANPGTGQPPMSQGFPSNAGFGGPSAPGTPGSRIEGFFGQTGIQSTPLQRQATGGIEQFLNQQSPESRTNDLLNPGLQGLFNQKLGTPDNITGALGGQLAGQNPLGQQGQDLLSGMMGGANPLSQQGQSALTGQLGQDFLGGGLGASLQGLLSGQGGSQGILQQLMQSGGGGADTSAIQQELAYNPNQQFMDALQPRFQQNLALADQAGGRFGSANAIQRSQATNDFNLLASQALQQDLQRRAGLASNLGSITGQSAANQNATRLGAGQLSQSGQLGAADALLRGQGLGAQTTQGAAGLLGQFGQSGIGNQQNAAGMQGGFAQQGLQNQQQVAQLLGSLGINYDQLNQSGQLGAGGLMGNLAGQAGQNDFNRLLGGYGVGQQQAQQNDAQTQRNLAILLQQLGGLQQATLGAPTTTTPSGNQQAMGVLGNVLSLGGLLGGKSG